ncbi:MAG TPA: twin transmembrane helix small protein [Woeseiaceae bacterium]|nr:twin transmembrane helix small protein [Woeseiaceae bacterium]
MKVIVFILLAAIVFSLGSGLFFLAKDDQNSTRLLTSLKIRVALSIVLLLFLLAAFYFGWLK